MKTWLGFGDLALIFEVTAELNTVKPLLTTTRIKEANCLKQAIVEGGGGG